MGGPVHSVPGICTGVFDSFECPEFELMQLSITVCTFCKKCVLVWPVRMVDLLHH